MAVLDGTQGSITVDAVAMDITAFSISGNVNLVDITALGNDSKSYHPTVKDLSGSLTFVLEDTEATQNQLLAQFIADAAVSSAALILTFASGSVLTGTAYISGFSVGGKVDDVYPISCNFQMTSGISTVPVSAT